MIEQLSTIDAIVLAAGYVLLLTTSGKVISTILSRVAEKPLAENVSREQLRIGAVVGKCENILLLTFIISNEYTALSLIFAAKAIIRKEDIEHNSLFFLAGTMINVTYSIVVGIIIKIIVR